MFPSPRSLSTPKGRILIRPAIPGDVQPFCELRLEALHDNPAVFGSSYEARENCSPEWAQRVLQADIHESCNFVAENEQQMVGMTSIRRLSGLKTRHSANIGGVFIQPAWRGIGILDALFSACFEWAENNQIIILKLAVVNTNLTALKAYQRLGFTIYGSDLKVILHEKQYYDEVLMFREI